MQATTEYMPRQPSPQSKGLRDLVARCAAQRRVCRQGEFAQVDLIQGSRCGWQTTSVIDECKHPRVKRSPHQPGKHYVIAHLIHDRHVNWQTRNHEPPHELGELWVDIP